MLGIVRKVSEPMRCCFCGSGTAEAGPQQYVELEVTFPGWDGPMRQFFGAHVRCFEAKAAPGFTVANPLTGE
jgi:hypothetical protein